MKKLKWKYHVISSELQPESWQNIYDCEYKVCLLGIITHKWLGTQWMYAVYWITQKN